MDVNAELERLNALHATGAHTQDGLAAALAAMLAGVGADTAPVGPRADADDVVIARLRRQLAEATIAGEVAQLDMAWERDRAANEARNALFGRFYIGPIPTVLAPGTAGRLHGILWIGLGLVWIWATLTGQADGEGFDLTRGYEHNAMVIALAAIGLAILVFGIRSISRAQRRVDAFEDAERAYRNRRAQLVAGDGPVHDMHREADET